MNYGFLTLPENWDAETSFIALRINDRWNDVNMKAMKIKLIESLPSKIRQRREAFLSEFIN